MSIRRFPLKTAALLALATALLPASAQQPATNIATSTVLTITTPSTLSYGEVVAGYAQVSSSNGSTLTGTVTFYDGSIDICMIPVTQTTSCPASAGTGFPVGTHMLTALYSGDASHLGSISNTVPVVVVPDATTTSLATSANPSAQGQNVAFTATAHGTHAMPSGPVTFLDGSTILGTAPSNSSGAATFVTASLAMGTHSITANYSGDANTAASSSSPLVEVVNASSAISQDPFTVTVIGTPTVDTGRTVNLLVTVAPRIGTIQPVKLSCTGLPSESACTFGTETLPVNGGTTSLQISTIAPHDCGSTSPYFQSEGLPLAAPSVAGLMLLFIPRRKRKSLKGLLVILIAACGLATLMGCGNCTDLGTRPGDYSIKVIGTSTGASANMVIAKVVLHVTVP